MFLDVTRQYTHEFNEFGMNPSSTEERKMDHVDDVNNVAKMYTHVKLQQFFIST